MRALGPWLVLWLSVACGGGESKCAVRSENCSATYLRENGKTGCCSELSCQDSAVTPGARVCR